MPVYNKDIVITSPGLPRQMVRRDYGFIPNKAKDVGDDCRARKLLRAVYDNR